MNQTKQQPSYPEQSGEPQPQLEPKKLKIWLMLLAAIVVAIFLIGWVVLTYQKIINEADKQVIGQYGNKMSEQKTLFSGKLIDRDGDLISQKVGLYLITASKWERLDIKDNEYKGRDNSDFQITTNDKSEFVAEIQNGKYYLFFSGWWKPDGSSTYLGPIEFNGDPVVLDLKLREQGYEDKKDRFVYITAKEGDTLWSIAEEYYGSGKYWPIMARINDISLMENKNVLIKVGDQIMVPEKTWYETDEVLDIIRNSVYKDKINTMQTYINEEFGYSIQYPGLWVLNKAGEGNTQYSFAREKRLHMIELLGPTYQPRMNSYSDKPVHVIVWVFDNSQDSNLRDFVKDHDFVNRIGTFKIEELNNGGFYLTDGSICYFQCLNHIFFSKDDKIYTLTFPILDYVKEANEQFYNELKSVIDSFDFL